MEYFRPIYVVFNQGECLIWWLFGAYFVYLIAAKRPRGRLLVPELLMVIAFAFFSWSDYIESNDAAGMPAYLWIWKIVNGTFLFGLLVWRDYVRRGRVALKPWRFGAAGIILGLAVYGMILSK